MRVKALGKLLTTLLVFSAVVLTSIIGNAQDPTPNCELGEYQRSKVRGIW